MLLHDRVSAARGFSRYRCNLRCVICAWPSSALGLCRQHQPCLRARRLAYCSCCWCALFRASSACRSHACRCCRSTNISATQGSDLLRRERFIHRQTNRAACGYRRCVAAASASDSFGADLRRDSQTRDSQSSKVKVAHNTEKTRDLLRTDVDVSVDDPAFWQQRSERSLFGAVSWQASAPSPVHGVVDWLSPSSACAENTQGMSAALRACLEAHKLNRGGLLETLVGVGVREPCDILHLDAEPESHAEVDAILASNPLMRNRWLTLVEQLSVNSAPTPSALSPKPEVPERPSAKLEHAMHTPAGTSTPFALAGGHKASAHSSPASAGSGWVQPRPQPLRPVGGAGGAERSALTPTAAPSPPVATSSPAIHVCLNVANIGHYGLSKGQNGSLAFSWVQVEAAFDYYAQRVGRQGVCGVCSPYTLQRNPPPAGWPYADRMLAAPVRDGVRDVDDVFTIRIAKQHGCQFVRRTPARHGPRTPSSGGAPPSHGAPAC